jgi:sugar phosphate isomerase/epimerase
MTARWSTAYIISSPECRSMFDLGYQAALPAALDALAELGYDGVEIQMRDPDAAQAADLVREVSARGLRIAALGSGPVSTDDGLTLSSPDARVRTAAVERLRRIIDLGIDQHAPVTLGRTRGDLLPGIEDQQRGWALDAIHELGAHAARGGQQLLVEPQSVGNFLLTVDETLRFLRPVPQGVALVFDIWHATQQERSVEAAATAAGPLIRHVQLAGSERDALGPRADNIRSLLDLLHRLGYRGWLTLEHRQHPDSRHAAQTSLSALRGLEKPNR